MEKKFELTPEMQAKIDEIKKDHDIRELSPADLDGVAGGNGPTVNVYGTEMGEAEFNAFMCEIAESFGIDVAFMFFQEITGEDPYSGEYKGSGSFFSSTAPRNVMNVILNTYWRLRCGY